MKTIRVFARTATKFGEGYYWTDVKVNEDVGFSTGSYYQDLMRYIDKEVPSIVIGSANGKLIVLITNLVSDRIDFHKRIIVNSLILEFDLDEEALVRKFIQNILRENATPEHLFKENFQKSVDSCFIDNGDTYEVDKEKLDQIIWKAIDGEMLDDSGENDFVIISKSYSIYRKIDSKAIDELVRILEGNPFPLQEKESTFNPILVVTGLKEAKLIAQAGTWITLTGIVKNTKQEKWLLVKSKEESIAVDFEHTGYENLFDVVEEDFESVEALEVEDQIEAEQEAERIITFIRKTWRFKDYILKVSIEKKTKQNVDSTV